VAGSKSTIATLKGKTEGFDKVRKDLDNTGKSAQRLDRNTTRLGQTSASSGRQFSAQAQGLGGLVGAYAGAAATIFALSAAFQALNRAARAEQTITGVNALASAVGEQGPKIIRSIQEITKGQLSLVQAAELANLALSSGFSGQQIEQLADISLRASRALGRDLTDSFNRLVRGVTKLEPELLDELGIFVRIEPAAEAYAASIGKVASQLTAFEKRQAFANAVAAEGSEKFASIDTSAETTAESLESLVATLSDIGISVGGFIASVIQPLVEALGKPVTAIASFGILARAVFGRALVELQGSLSKVSNGAESFGDKIGDSIASTKKATQANAKYSTSLDGIRLNQARVSEANRAAFNSLIEGGRAATLNTTQIKQLRDITEVELASVNKSIAAKKQQIETARAAGRGTITLEKQLTALENRQTSFNTVLDSTNSRLKASGPVARSAAGSITFLGKSIATAGRAVLGVVAAIGTFITIASIIVAVGSTILEAFGWLEPVTEFFKNSIQTIRRWLGITKEASQQAKVAKEIANSLVEANDALFITGKRIDSLAFFTGNYNAIQEIPEDAVAKALQGAIKSGATASADLFALSFRSQLVSDGIEVSQEDAKALFANLFGDITGITAGQLQVISDFAEATGRTLKTAIDQVELAGDGTVLLQGAEQLPGLLAQAAIKTRDYKNLTGEAREEAIGINKAAIRNLQLQELSLNLLDSLNNGNATLEQIEKRRGAILNQISTIEKEIEKSSGIKKELLEDSLSLVQSTLIGLDREAQAQIAILSTRKQIRETFSAEIKASEKLTELFKLQETLGGNLLDIALDSNEADRARIAGLLQSYEIGKEALALQRSGVELDSRQAQLAALARDAQAALNGNFVKAIENARKLAEQVEKITDKQNDQLESLQLKIRIERESLKLTQQKLQLERDASRVKNENAITDALNSQVTAAFDRRQAIRDLRKEEALALNESIGGILEGPRAQQIEIAFATESLAALKAFNEEQRKLLTENFTREEQLLNKQIAFQESLLADQGGPGGGTNAIEQRLALQNSLEQAKIDATRDAQLVEIDLLEQRNQGILEEAKAFTDHIEGIASVLAADIVARRELLAAQMGRDFSTEATYELFNTLISGTEAQKQALEAVGLGMEALEDAAYAGGGVLDVATARRGLTALQTADVTPQLRDSLNQLITRLEDSGSFEAARKAVQDVAEAETNLANLRLQSATATQIAEAERNLADLRTKLTTISIDYGISLDELTAVYGSQKAALNALNVEYARSRDAMLKIKNIIRDTLTDTVENGLMELNTALIEGNLTFKSAAQGFRDMLGSMIREIQAAVFRQTIAQPIAEYVGGLFDSQQRGADNAKVIDGALLVTTGTVSSVGGIEDTIGALNTAQQKQAEVANTAAEATEQQKGFFATIIDGFKAAGTGVVDFFGSIFSALSGSGGGGGIGSFFSGIFGQGGLNFGQLFGGDSNAMLATGAATHAEALSILQLQSDIASGTAILDPGLFAAGGLVKRFAGGGNVNYQDRVPALLQPGEFVMKKSAVKAMGAGNMAMMNATGSGGNVVVNINNQGTPQEAQASQPTFDGEKYVIDIVTRDLRNNGPIRKSLRGGAA